MKGRKKGSAPEGGSKERRLSGEQNPTIWSRGAAKEHISPCYTTSNYSSSEEKDYSNRKCTV